MSSDVVGESREWLRGAFQLADALEFDRPYVGTLQVRCPVVLSHDVSRVARLFRMGKGEFGGLALVIGLSILTEVWEDAGSPVGQDFDSLRAGLRGHPGRVKDVTAIGGA
jgi:hypothetical protein